MRFNSLWWAASALILAPGSARQQGVLRGNLGQEEINAEGHTRRSLAEMGALVDMITPDTQVSCPWQASLTAKTYNFGANDANVVYQFLIALNVNSTQILKVSGQFPKDVRYFSFQTYRYGGGQDIEEAVLAKGLPDYLVKPSTGINVFSLKNPTSAERAMNSTYDIYITPSGKEGLTNELRLLPTNVKDDDCDKGRGCLAVLIYRFYHDKVGVNSVTGGGYTKDDIWGNAPKPNAYMRTSTGEYKMIPHCLEEGGPTLLHQAIMSRVNSLADTPVNVIGGEDTYFTTPNNFVMWRNNSYLPNDNVVYVVAGGTLPEKSKDVELVMKVRGIIPVFSRGLDEPPFAGDLSSYDLRFMSVSTVWMAGVSPLGNSINDATIEDFYKKANPDKKWNGKFSIAIASSVEMASKCKGLYNPEEDLYLTTTPVTLSGNVSRPASLGVCVRHLMATPRFKKSAQAAKEACLKEKQCDSPKFLQSVMQEYYPLVQWYQCNSKTGEMIPFNKKFPASYGEPATTELYDNWE